MDASCDKFNLQIIAEKREGGGPSQKVGHERKQSVWCEDAWVKPSDVPSVVLDRHHPS